MQTPIVAKLNGFYARTVLHNAPNEICIFIKFYDASYKGYNAPHKNIKSPCKIRIRLVWHNQYIINKKIYQVFSSDKIKLDYSQVEFYNFINLNSYKICILSSICCFCFVIQLSVFHRQ